MLCAHCGTQLPDGSTVCTNCGRVQNQPAASAHVKEWTTPVYATSNASLIVPATGAKRVPTKPKTMVYRVVIGSFIVTTAFAVLSAILDFVLVTDRPSLEFLYAVRTGNPLDAAWIEEIMTLPRSVAFLSYGVVAMATAFVYLVTSIAFLVWFYRSYKCLQYCGFRLTYKPRWTVLGFIVPILNLWRPFQMMKQISSVLTALSREGKPDAWKSIKSSPPVRWWWILFLGWSFVSSREFFMLRRADQFNEFVTGLWFSIAVDLILIAAAMATLRLVRYIDALQESARTNFPNLQPALRNC